MWNRINQQQPQNSYSQLYDITSYAPNSVHCDRCGRGGHDRKSCRVPSTCFFCGSAMHSTRGCDTTRANSGPKNTSEASAMREEHENLIEFSPKQVSSRSNFDIEHPPSLCNLDRSKEDVRQPPTNSSTKSLTNDTLLDKPIKEPGQDGVFTGKEETVQVTLRRKRKGRKGKSSTYDLTPFLSY